MRHSHYLIAVFASVACLTLVPSEAAACSCADWNRVGVAEARTAFLDEWIQAEAAVSGTVVASSDIETIVRVSRTLKGEAPKVLRIFPRRVEPTIQRQGNEIKVGLTMDCRPSLDLQTEYLILLYKHNGALDASRCTVWAGRDREQRLGWIPQSRK